MIEQLLLLFQALFIAFLFLFIWMVIRSGRRDLRLAQESFVLAPAQAQKLGYETVPKARLVIEASPSIEPGRVFDVGTGAITIGRSGENAIPLPDDDFASAKHARIEPQRDGIWIADLGSTNGTYVNGEQVERREQLHEGDVVKIGETELRVAR